MVLFRSWQLGKLFGIPIRIDPSWVLIFLLLTYQLAAYVLPIELGTWRQPGIVWEVIVLAVIASLLLFVSVLAHELAHALMARIRGVPVLGITLFIFGGVAQISDEPDTPATEFLIAIVGPLISFVIAILCAGIWIWLEAFNGLGWYGSRAMRTATLYVSVVAFYLAQANLLLGLFNLLPGFPLDGGRVLRAGVWALLHDQRKATFVGMVSGRVLGGALALLGGWFILRGEMSGIWLLLMAWFLWRAAGEAYHAMVARDLLRQVTVGELMRTPVPRVSEALSLRELAESFAVWLKSPALAVDLNGNGVGFVGIEQVKKIDRAQWESTRVRQAMVPLLEDTTVVPTDLALTALKRLTEREHEDVAVMQAGQVVGSIGRIELARYLKTKGE